MQHDKLFCSSLFSVAPYVPCCVSIGITMKYCSCLCVRTAAWFFKMWWYRN